MSQLQIAQNITTLRKQKGITQETFAQAMGVTGQAVSKWESGASCPDIGLLPDIAAYFGASVDELLGYRPATTMADAILRIKAAFASTPAEDAFGLAYQLCHALHEGAISHGYKRRLPWQGQDRDDDSFKAWTAQWGYSACNEPEGNSIMKRGAAFFSSTGDMPPVTAADIRSLLRTLEPLAQADVLKTLFALYSLTADDESRYASLDETAQAAGLATGQVTAALEQLPTDTKNGGYRLAGGYMMVPAILSLLIPPQ